MSNVLIISGSPVTPSKSAALLGYASEKLAAQGIQVNTVSIRDFPAEDLVQANYASPAFAEFKQLIEEASGIIIGTPIYKASFTGGLKALLDILPQNSLRWKTLLPVATGGTLAHLLAIDYSLKPVLAVLGATDLRQGVYVVDSQFTHNADGSYTLADDLQERYDESLERFAHTVLNQQTVALSAVA